MHKDPCDFTHSSLLTRKVKCLFLVGEPSFTRKKQREGLRNSVSKVKFVKLVDEQWDKCLFVCRIQTTPQTLHRKVYCRVPKDPLFIDLVFFVSTVKKESVSGLFWVLYKTVNKWITINYIRPSHRYKY